MSSQREQLDKLIQSLKQDRDQLRLRTHLAQMEAKQEFERLSDRIDELSQQYEPVREAVEESAGNLIAALRLAADEMKGGLQRVGKAIRDSSGL